MINTTRKNRKYLRKSMRGKGRKLNSRANEFIPAYKRMESSINNISERMNKLRINSGESPNQVSDLAKKFFEFKASVENAVAIDCEMVGGGGGQSILAHVAICDFNGNELYNKYVLPKGGLGVITDYRTKYSGITPEILTGLDKRTHSFHRVKSEVHKILKNKTIVGHGLMNDFKVLELRPHPSQVWDTTEIEIYQQNDPSRPGKKRARKLKVLAKEFANNNIQKNTDHGHSPLEDARASMNLYRIALGYSKITYNNMTK